MIERILDLIFGAIGVGFVLFATVFFIGFVAAAGEIYEEYTESDKE